MTFRCSSAYSRRAAKLKRRKGEGVRQCKTCSPPIQKKGSNISHISHEMPLTSPYCLQEAGQEVSPRRVHCCSRQRPTPLSWRWWDGFGSGVSRGDRSLQAPPLQSTFGPKKQQKQGCLVLKQLAPVDILDELLLCCKG